MHYMSSTLKSSRRLTRSSALALRLVRVQFVRVRVPGASLTTGRQLSAPLNTIAARLRYAARRNSGYRYVRTELVSVPLATSCGEEYADASCLSRAECVQDFRCVRSPFEFPKETREPFRARAYRDAGNGIARIICTEFGHGICRDLNSTQIRSRSHSASDFSRARVSCCKSASYALVTCSHKASDMWVPRAIFGPLPDLGGIVKGGATPLVFISPFDK